MSKVETLDTPDDVDIDLAGESGSRDADAVEFDAEPDADHTVGETKSTAGRWNRMLVFGLLPLVIVLLAGAAGYLSYRNHSATAADVARVESVRAATDSTVALLSYKADSADKTLNDAKSRLTGSFRDSYSKLVNDVVIPGARQKHLSSVATVAAAAPVSADARHAEVLVFVNQVTTAGSDAPTSTASCVKVTLDKVGDQWLISQFDPI